MGFRAGPYEAGKVLAEASVRHSEETVRFLARLLGYPACDHCGFVVDHCRCDDRKKAYMSGVTWQGEGLA